MKKILLITVSLFSLTCAQNAFATFTILRDASTLTRGKMPTARLDYDSATVQGHIDLSQIATSTGTTAQLSNDTTTLKNMISSSNTAFNVFTGSSDAQQTKFQNFRTTTDANMTLNGSGVIFSSMTSGLLKNTTDTFTGSLTLNGDFTFQTTYYFSFTFPFAVGFSTYATINSSAALNGLAYLDGSLSTPSLNQCYYKIPISPNFVTGSSWTLTNLATISKSAASAQESWVLSFATGSGYAMAISTEFGGATLTWTNPVVVNINGTIGAAGGERTMSTPMPLPGIGPMVGSGGVLLYIRAVRDGTSINDTSNVNSAISFGFLAGRFQQ